MASQITGHVQISFTKINIGTNENSKSTLTSLQTKILKNQSSARIPNAWKPAIIQQNLILHTAKSTMTVFAINSNSSEYKNNIIYRI